MEKLDKEYVLHTYNREYINFIKGDNATLFDEESNDYIDFTSGIGVVSVGHGNQRVADVICNQAKNILHISNLFYIEPQAVLAEKIVKTSGMDGRIFFANSGAEANEGALKIARKYGEKNGEIDRYKIITIENSFHGRTISTLKATGQEKMHLSYFGPYPDGFSYAKNIADIYNKIDEKTVAVMLELIQGEGGVTPFDKEEIQKLASFLKEKDILLIVDEVQTGIYRTGEFLASNVYEIEPDIITMAKGLGGGVPIGAVFTKHKDILKPGEHGSTFGGNYLVTAAAIEVLNILEEYKESGKLDENFIYFETELQKIADEFNELFIGVSGFGMMRALRAKSADIQSAVIKNAFTNRLLVLKAGNNAVRMLPPITISKDEMKIGFERLREALREI
jgi:acetylornithine aminotransferase